MKSVLFLIAFFAMMCFSFASHEASETFDLQGWKKIWASYPPATRAEYSKKFINFFNNAPAVIQDALAEDIVEVAAQDAESHSDLAEAEFVCGGICIGIGVAVAGGLAYFGHEKGRKDGFKADPIHHYRKDDDESFFGIVDKFVKAHDWAKDITYNLLSDKRGGGRHVYVYDENDAAEEVVDAPAFLTWTQTWNSFSKEQQKELFEEVKPVFEEMTEEERVLAEERVHKAVAFQNNLGERVSENDFADAEFVCGGVCITVAIGAGIGIFKGAYDAGKEKTQLHVHHLKR